MDYTVLADCLEEVKNNPAVRGLIRGTEYDGYLTNQLQISAGLKVATVYYRPYYVAAKFLEQLRSQQAIAKADGAEFTGLQKPIESLLGQQIALDKSLGLEVPAGFEAILPGCVTCESTGGFVRRRTRSHSTTARP